MMPRASPEPLPALLDLPELSPEEFRHLSELFSQQLGFRFPDSKQKLIAVRLSSRLRELGLRSYHDYWRLLQGADAAVELQRAIDLVTTNETYFFREMEHFDFLRQVLIPAARGRPLRLWSAACSSGQEAYSLAMILAETQGIGAAWEVLGSDISERMLQRARRALYPLEEAAHIPPELLRKYCLKGQDEYAGQLLISSALRQRVRFEQLNLMQALPAGLTGFDGVFLRNVMIYLESERRDEMIERIKPRISLGGYLIVGQAESMAVQAAGFRLVQSSVYQRV